MSNLDELLERNQAFARAGTHEGLAPLPKHQVLVISCIDPRVDPAHFLDETTEPPQLHSQIPDG